MDAPSSQLAARLRGGAITLIGECHGTIEIPRFVGESAAATTHASIAVALETPRDLQHAIDAYVAGELALGTMLTTPSFLWECNDGRSSAMIALFGTLRELRLAGRDVQALCLDGACRRGSARSRHGRSAVCGGDAANRRDRARRQRPRPVDRFAPYGLARTPART